MKNIYLALMVSLAASSSDACQTLKFDAPYTLVLRADAIYRASADKYVLPVNKNGRTEPPRIVFTILETIKGPPKMSIRFPGVTTALNDKNDMTVPYNFVRPAGRHGKCYATSYKLGQEYLLYIKGGTPYWSRLAPTNEEIGGDTDAWLLWTRKSNAYLTRHPGAREKRR